LAYAIGQPPLLDAPERSDDLPAVYWVLGFAPLVRDFYRKSGMDERLVPTCAYRAEGDPPASCSLRNGAGSSFIARTRPIALTTERVRVRAGQEAGERRRPSTREHERHFYIVPDLLAAPGTVNFHVITRMIITRLLPEGTDPMSPGSVMRSAVRDRSLVRKFNKEISAQRDQVKQLIDLRTKAGVSLRCFYCRRSLAACRGRSPLRQCALTMTSWQRRGLQRAKTTPNESDSPRLNQCARRLPMKLWPVSRGL
jgi:hypothetical protein